MGGSNCKSFSPKSSGRVKPSQSSSSMSTKKSEDQGKSEEADYIEDVVCKETDIQENEMKLLPLGTDGEKILLIKQQGKLHALGSKCTHYGALLHTGALGEGRVRCPWHGACFNIENGDIEDYPGLDSIPCYKVSIAEGLIKVRAKRTELSSNRKTKLMYELKSDNPDTVVIVGGGPAGATCAETLRQEGFEGRIVMVCKENVLPYDRIKLSKAIDVDVQKILLRSQCFYDKHNIETRIGLEAVSLNISKQMIVLSNEEKLCYTNLFIATGSKARRPDIPGINLKNIFTIRNYDDAEALHKQLSMCKKHVVVLGSSFIGMEIAAYCLDKSSSVTIIGRYCYPLTPVFGDQIGKQIKKQYEENGVKFIAPSGITKFIPKASNDEVVGQVELKDGTILPADIVVLGVGSCLNTDWLKDSGLEILNDGSLPVDMYLNTNCPKIFAGGDIAHAPVYANRGKQATIGHFGLAHYHGKIAAKNICKKETPLRAVPFFWTTLFGKSYRYAGYGTPTSFNVHGSVKESKFYSYHIQDCKVIAMSSLGRDPIVSDFANYVYEGKTLTEKEVTKDPTKWMRNPPADLRPAPPQQVCESLLRMQNRKYHTLTAQKLNTGKFFNVYRAINYFSMFKHNIHKFLL